jgi:hypothetical protein
MRQDVATRSSVVFPLSSPEERRRANFPWERSRLGSGSCGEGMRVDLVRGSAGTRGDTLAQPSLNAFDLSKRVARVRAFVVAVLDDQTTAGRGADVIDRVVERLHVHLMLWHVPRLPTPAR